MVVVIAVRRTVVPDVVPGRPAATNKRRHKAFRPVPFSVNRLLAGATGSARDSHPTRASRQSSRYLFRVAKIALTRSGKVSHALWQGLPTLPALWQGLPTLPPVRPKVSMSARDQRVGDLRSQEVRGRRPAHSTEVSRSLWQGLPTLPHVRPKVSMSARDQRVGDLRSQHVRGQRPAHSASRKNAIGGSAPKPPVRVSAIRGQSFRGRGRLGEHTNTDTTKTNTAAPIRVGEVIAARRTGVPEGVPGRPAATNKRRHKA